MGNYGLIITTSSSIVYENGSVLLLVVKASYSWLLVPMISNDILFIENSIHLQKNSFFILRLMLSHIKRPLYIFLISIVPIMELAVGL